MSAINKDQQPSDQLLCNLKVPIKKQNAISFTLTPDSTESTTNLNEDNENISKTSTIIDHSLSTVPLPQSNSKLFINDQKHPVTHLPGSLATQRLKTVSKDDSEQHSFNTSNESDLSYKKCASGNNNQALRVTPVIPNLFFTKLSSIDDLEDCTDNKCDTSPKSQRGLQSQVFISNQPSNYQGPMRNNPTVHELACRSASSSPRIARSSHIRPINDSNPACSLNVPNSQARKFSLQPFNQQQHPQLSKVIENAQKQPVLLNNQIYQHNLGGSATNLNTLAVSNQHLMPRKSVIGRLERSSFQAQRLSDVGVAFGQQITAKMGLKLPASQERIVEQTRWLYLRYVFVKLRQNSLPLRDLNLTKSSRARRAAALGESVKISNSAPASAMAMTDLVAPSRAKINRKRTALSQDLITQDLSMLANKMRTINMNNEDLINNGNSNQENSNENQATNLVGTANRKYIMDPTINNQIFTVIFNIIRELRELKPEYYGDTIYELIGIDKFSSLQSLLDVQMTICQEMTRSEISWCRIAALFSLFGAMSLDCVRLGTPEHVGPILDGFIEFVERDLALWISQRGGWESFLYKYRAGFRYGHIATKVITLTLPLFVWIVFSMCK